MVAGDKAAIKRFRRAAREKKIKAIPLGVSTAFHSPMMIPAAEKLKDVLTEAGLKTPEMKVYANVTADDMMKDFNGGDAGAYLADILSKQAMSPVHWDDIIKRFHGDGVKAIIEVGPGKNSDRTYQKDLPGHRGPQCGKRRDSGKYSGRA